MRLGATEALALDSGARPLKAAETVPRAHEALKEKRYAQCRVPVPSRTMALPPGASRGAIRRPRRLGWRPRRSGARCERCERGGRRHRGKMRAGLPGRRASFADKAASCLACATSTTAVVAMGGAGGRREGPRTVAGPQSRFAASSGRQPAPRGLPRAVPLRVPGAGRPRGAPRAGAWRPRGRRRGPRAHQDSPPGFSRNTLHTNLSPCGDSPKTNA